MVATGRNRPEAVIQTAQLKTHTQKSQVEKQLEHAACLKGPAQGLIQLRLNAEQ